MKLIFRQDGTLWVIGKDSHPDVEGATSYLVPDDYNPIVSETISETGPTITYITHEEFLQNWEPGAVQI